MTKTTILTDQRALRQAEIANPRNMVFVASRSLLAKLTLLMKVPS